MRGALLLGLVLAIGCAPQPPAPTEVTVGAHQVALVVPDGWQHYDHGRQQRFEKGMAKISLADMGPGTREGFKREVEYARELFRRGQIADARDRLGRLQVRRAFPSDERWRVFLESWRVVRGTRRDSHPDSRTVERAYGAILAQISALPDPNLPSIARVMLDEMGHDERHDIAEEEAMAVDRRDALRVDTWDRLSHDFRKRYVFILDGGNILVAWTEFGKFAEMEEAFDALVASLELLER
jgi:hypothetical protein